MKDNFAFAQSVFEKSEAILEKRKKRIKVMKSALATSFCILFLTLSIFLLPLAQGKGNLLNKFAPTKEVANDFYYSGDASNVLSDLKTSVEEDSPTNPKEDSDAESGTVTQYYFVFDTSKTDGKLPDRIEIDIFGKTASLYTEKGQIENIIDALEKYSALEEKSEKATVCVKFLYRDKSVIFNVGDEFLELLK